MSLILRSMIPLTLFATLGSFGCKDSPTGVTSESASAAAAQQKNRVAPLSPQVRIDPVIAKVYRAEACYYGTLSLKQARAAYLGSLGGAEPSATKIPDFGSASVDVPLGPKGPSPTGSASASTAAHAPSAAPSVAKAPAPPPPKPAPTPVASAKASPSGAPVASAAATDPTKAAAMDRRLHSIPYDRFARSCTVAAGIKVPESPEFDAVMAEYAPFAVQLAKDLGTANIYYQKEDYKTDDFAKGKELHGKIVEGFKKLDELQKKVGAALADFKQKNPYDQQPWSDSEKLSFLIVDACRDVFLDLEADKVDVAKAKADIDKLDALDQQLKKWGEEHKEQNSNDPFVRIVIPSVDVLIKQSQDIIGKPDFKAPLPSDMVALTTYFTRVLEGNNRSVARMLADKDGPAAFQSDRIHRLPVGHPGMPATDNPQ